MSSETAKPNKKSGFSTDAEISSLVVIAGLTAVLFAGGLALSEGVPELGADIDFKPFFIVYAVILFVPWGTPTIAAAVGATLAEGLLDMIEGYEPDEPFGWAGYIIAFTFVGWYWKDTSLDNKTKLFIGAILGALIQFAIEGLFFFALGAEATTIKGTSLTLTAAPMIYAVALLGNTTTHGLILGAIPLFPTIDALKGRVRRLLAPEAQTQEKAAK